MPRSNLQGLFSNYTKKRYANLYNCDYFYTAFITHHFEQGGFRIDLEAIKYIYDKFEGTTWYIQKICNEIYAMAEPDKTCGLKEVESVIDIDAIVI